MACGPEIVSSDTRVPEVFARGTLSVCPESGAKGIGFRTGSPSSAQGQEVNPAQHSQDSAAIPQSAMTAAIPGRTWASWKTSPMIRAMTAFEFINVNESNMDRELFQMIFRGDQRSRMNVTPPSTR
jgi:hypothetical protein